MKNMTDEQQRYRNTQDTYSNRIRTAYNEADGAKDVSAILEQEKQYLVDQLQHISAEELGMLDKLESLSNQNANIYNIKPESRGGSPSSKRGRSRDNSMGKGSFHDSPTNYRQLKSQDRARQSPNPMKGNYIEKLVEEIGLEEAQDE